MTTAEDKLGGLAAGTPHDEAFEQQPVAGPAAADELSDVDLEGVTGGGYLSPEGWGGEVVV